MAVKSCAQVGRCIVGSMGRNVKEKVKTKNGSARNAAEMVMIAHRKSERLVAFLLVFGWLRR